jgi:hypothetical protein
LIPHCSPDAFYESSSGNIDLKLNAKNVVLMGGNYLLCLNDTWVGLSKAIEARASQGDLNLVFVTNAVYDNLPSLQSAHSLISEAQSRFLMPRVGMSPNYARLTEFLAPDLTIEMMARYFQRRSLPSSYEVRGYWKGREFLIQKSRDPRHRVRVHYVLSSELEELFTRLN